MADLSGQVLGGRYRVELFLGRGGMADVYQVLDQQRAVHLALKVLHSELAEDIKFLERFEQEAQTLEILQHPNIVRFYGLERLDGMAVILMDYIDGLTLRKEIQISRATGGMRPGRILQVLRPVCAALYYAHQMGMVHCDIKPVNIMIHRNGTVFLTDFGIARMTEASAQAFFVAGTPAYMAPEQITGHLPTPAVDIYALGVVLFEMLTGGQRPFTGESTEASATTTGSLSKKIVWEKNHLPAPSPRSVNPSVAPALEAVALRCLERDPEKRYATALEMLQALEAAVKQDETDEATLSFQDFSDEILFAKEVPAPHAARRRIHPWWVAALLGALLLAVTAFVALANPGRLNQPLLAPPGSTAVRSGQVTQVTAPQATRTQAPAPTSLPTATLLATLTPVPQPTRLGSSKWIAFISDRSGSPQVWIMNPMQPEDRRQLTNQPYGACQPAWAPDGQRIAFTTPCKGPSIYYPGATIKVVNLADLSITDLGLKSSGSFDPAWSPDGKTLAFTTIVLQKTVIQALDLATGQVSTLATRGTKNSQPAWSPDSSHLLFITADNRYHDALWLMRRVGDSQEIFNDSAVFSEPAFSPDGSQVLVTTNTGNNRPVLMLFERAAPNQPGVPLLSADDYNQHYASFSPDGKWVVFWSDQSKVSGEIMLASSDGKSMRPLTDNNERDFQPAWSPK